MKLSASTFLVREYDEAIHWFVNVLGFELLEDTVLSPTKRWVRVAAQGDDHALLLAKADGMAQTSSIGCAAGGRVAYFLHVEDFNTTHARLSERGVTFLERPRHEVFGTVAVFEDLYGNRWDLIGPPTKG